MSFLRSKKAGRRIGAIVLAAAVGGAFACNADRQDVTFQVGDYVFNFLIDAQLQGGFPAGAHSIDDFSVVFDPTVADGFERSTDALPGFDGWDWVWGQPQDRSWDGRAPTLSQTTPITVGTGLLMESPNTEGGPYYNIWVSGNMTGIEALNATYTVAFVRYGVDVKGELDQAATLLGLPITQPDELVVLNPNPLGDPNVDINYYTTGNTGDTIPAIPGANPFIIGHANVDGSGASDIGIMISAADAVYGGNPYFYTNFTDNPPTDAMLDSAMWGRNDGVAFAPTSYNYIVMFEGLGVDGTPIARWQVAQDLDLSGNPLNNAFYPYPTAALSKADQLALPCCAGAASDLTFTFEYLDELVGNVYQVWLWNEETGDLISPSGDWEARDSEDNVANSANGVSSFPSMADWTHTFTTSDALAGTSVGDFTHVFLSVESSAAATPSGAQPLWSQYTDMAGDPADPFGWSFNETGEMPFGTFGSGDPVVFSGAGRGEGGFWGQQTGVSDLLIVSYRNLELPPVGYFYEAWMIDDDGSQVNVGELLTTHTEDPPYSSLRDLDIDPSLSEYISTDGLILWSETRTQLACPSETGGCVDSQPFYEFLMYRLTLTPKSGTGVMPPTTVLGGMVPEPVKKRAPTPEPAGQ
jgi:hypothetical protein